jgi:tRNA (mo5U34)-methyltransferase
MFKTIINKILGKTRGTKGILNDFSMPKFIVGETNINQWIAIGVKGFKEWYQPVDFGDGIVAHVTTPPLWEDSPELDRVRGIAKWNYIVKKHIPSLDGKRVLDLGCNNGVFSIQLARSGAKQVIGIDRNQLIRQKSGSILPVQDVIAQATFVKQAIEFKENKKYPINYISHDIGKLNKLNLGKFDLILALCVVYHEMSDTPKLIKTLSLMTDHIILQSTLLHSGELAKWASPNILADLLTGNGFNSVEIDAPFGYSWPMIIGKRLTEQ